ncbi:MAG: deoxyribonuclease V [Chloroflexi bacterium]|nr:deoxyribonuclease V [Chloroflexota bacterium]
MEIKRLHPWGIGVPEAIKLQNELAGLVVTQGDIGTPGTVAGVDVAVSGKYGLAAVVVLSYPELEPVETAVAGGRLEFPYVPGLLSFREIPLALDAFRKLQHHPDLVMVDGQGYAHPRRIGLASHLGLALDRPTVGCAKSRLCGEHDEPGQAAGAVSWLRDNGETIGAAVRTRRGVKPLYVSAGHMTSLASAIHWVVSCCRGYRCPEPTRLAHLAARANLTPVMT